MSEDRSGCHMCIHMHFYPGHPGWSEWTPGDDMSFFCMKSHWAISREESSARDVREALARAKDCTDFFPVKP